MKRTLMITLLTLPAATLPACTPSPAKAPGAPLVSEKEVERRRAQTRAQFEAAARGERHQSAGPHSLFNCPHCTDPLKGQIPDEALIDGPMTLWN